MAKRSGAGGAGGGGAGAASPASASTTSATAPAAGASAAGAGGGTGALSSWPAGGPVQSPGYGPPGTLQAASAARAIEEGLKQAGGLLPLLRFMQRSVNMTPDDLAAVLRAAGLHPLVRSLNQINFDPRVAAATSAAMQPETH